MFSNIIDVLQGPGKEAVDSDGEGSPVTQGVSDDGARMGPGFSIWGMASKLADTVKKGTAEIAASVAETNWRAELEAFGKEVAEDAQEASAFTVERLEALPDSVRQVPDRLTQLPPVDPEKVQQSLQQVGNTLRGFGATLLSGTATLFEQVQEAIAQEIEGIDGHLAKGQRGGQRSSARQAGVSGAKYSRLDADISAMQRNSSTYCDEPEDTADYNSWLATFDLSIKKEDIEQLTKSNAFMSELQNRIVPLIVQYDVFWTRYFYQLHKLQQKHEQRVQLAQRATRVSNEEEMGWDDLDTAATPRTGANSSFDVDAPEDSALEERPEGNKDVQRVGSTITPPALGSVKVVQSSRSPESTPEDVGSSSSSPLAVKVCKVDEEADTSTASDDSGGNGPWTVVTAGKGAAATGEQHDDSSSVASTGGGGHLLTVPEQEVVAPEARKSLETMTEEPPLLVESDGSAGESAAEAKPSADAKVSAAEHIPASVVPADATGDEDEVNSADLELSDEEVVPGPGAAGSDVDEDWGSWE